MKAKKQPKAKVEVDVNYILAAGMVARTTDKMILDGSAVERLRAALSLMNWGNQKATEYPHGAVLDFVERWIRPRLVAFEERFPAFPIEKFIDDVFEPERVFDGDDAFRDHRVGLSAKVKGDEILIGGNFDVMEEDVE